MNKRKSGKRKFKGFLRFLAALLVIYALLTYVNARVMPSVARAMESYGTRMSARAIDSAVISVIKRSGVTSSDLYFKTEDENGRVTSLSANTVLINTLCADVAEEILSKMEKIGEETVYMPLGIITGLDFLAAKGPRVFEITLEPVGDCVVDYKTSFKSEGINQVNYQIWMEATARVAVANPLMRESFGVVRRLPVVNTYISGDVPESMMYPFRLEQSGE